MTHAALLALWMLGASPTARAEEGTYRMDNLGGAVNLPKGWELMSGGWSDDAFKAQKANKHVLMRVWHTPYQPEITEDAARAWAEMFISGFEAQSGIKNVKVDRASVITLADRPTTQAWLSGAFKDGTPIVGTVLSFASGGKTVHVRTMGRANFKAEIEADARMLAETMTVDAGALDAETALKSGGFTATLPDGWRTPFDAELPHIKKITARLGEENLNPERCFVGIHPRAAADPDVLFSCEMYLHVGPVDEHSFAGVEAEVHEEFFGSSEKPVAAAEPVTVGDRMGFYYSPRDGVRLALAPYDKGMMTTWGLAGGEASDGLDEAIKATLGTVNFTGPEGGAPIIAPDKWVMYYIRYRPTSPPVLLGGVVLLGLVGGGVAFARRPRKNPYDIDDDDV
ncbi:MAG: hypothetical protein AAFV53_14085 [Myxococcota bacterium]